MLSGIFSLPGRLYGCAYLTRPEALLLLLASASFALLVAAFDRTGRSVPFLGIAGMIALFLLFASPYVLYLYRQTGVVRFEAKSNLNWVIGTKMLSGLSEAEANYGVTDGLEEEGVFLGKINEHIAAPRDPPRTLLLYVMASAKNQARNLYKGLIQMAWFGGPFFLCLIFFGLLRRTWDRTRLIRECYLFFILATIAIALLSLQYFQARYLFATLPFLILWAAKGIDELARLGRGYARSRFPRIAFRGGVDSPIHLQSRDGRAFRAGLPAECVSRRLWWFEGKHSQRQAGGSLASRATSRREIRDGCRFCDSVLFQVRISLLAAFLVIDGSPLYQGKATGLHCIARHDAGTKAIRQRMDAIWNPRSECRACVFRRRFSARHGANL